MKCNRSKDYLSSIAASMIRQSMIPLSFNVMFIPSSRLLCAQLQNDVPGIGHSIRHKSSRKCNVVKVGPVAYRTAVGNPAISKRRQITSDIKRESCEQGREMAEAGAGDGGIGPSGK